MPSASALRHFLLAASFGVVLIPGCGRSREPAKTESRKVLYWYDPMSPGSRFDHPGKSPFMDMELVPKYAEEQSSGEGSGTAALGQTIQLPPEALRAAGIATARVAEEDLRRTIRAVGTVEADERKLVHIASRVAGRLDRLHLNYTGQAVRQGAPIYEIYSPDLVASQREYLLAVDSLARARSGGDPSYIASAGALVNASRQRLALWGLATDQIEHLAATQAPQADLVVRAPISGTVLEKKAVAGQYVTEGQDLYLLADLSTVWLQARVYERDLGAVRLGQEATVAVQGLPGRDLRGRITFVDPVLDSATRTARVRIELSNSGGSLKPGMFANIELQVELGRHLAIPRSAVLDTGARQLVYVRTGPAAFRGREVKLGEPAGDRVAVLSGLQAGEEVVAAASFLIDSQSRLQTGSSVQWGGASEVKSEQKPPEVPR